MTYFDNRQNDDFELFIILFIDKAFPFLIDLSFESQNLKLYHPKPFILIHWGKITLEDTNRKISSI